MGDIETGEDVFCMQCRSVLSVFSKKVDDLGVVLEHIWAFEDIVMEGWMCGGCPRVSSKKGTSA